MPSDQAAGLRRLRQAQKPASITGFFARAESAQGLMQALAAQGKRVLLVDLDGRHFAATRTQSLFDWRQQLQRRQLQALPLAHGEGLFAPGAEGGEAEILEAAQAYDCVLFDAGALAPSVALASGLPQLLVLQMENTAPSLELGYALLKTLPACGNPSTVLLCGALSACSRLTDAAGHFLGAAMAQRIWAVGDEDAQFTPLAARIAAEETGCQAREEAGKPPKHG